MMSCQQTYLRSARPPAEWKRHVHVQALGQGTGKEELRSSLRAPLNTMSEQKTEFGRQQHTAILNIDDDVVVETETHTSQINARAKAKQRTPSEANQTPYIVRTSSRLATRQTQVVISLEMRTLHYRMGLRATRSQRQPARQQRKTDTT